MVVACEESWHSIAQDNQLLGLSLPRGRQELRYDLLPESRPEHISGHYVLCPEIACHFSASKATARISYTTWFPIQVKMTFDHLVMMRRFQMLCLSVIPVDAGSFRRTTYA
jgi:hypothetical protein